MIAEPLRQAIEIFDLEEHRARYLDRERDAALGLVVMVVGEGNFGKSSLVNALCGKDVAPVAVIPKTFKIDIYTHSSEENAQVRRVGEARGSTCSHAEARRINDEAEQAVKAGGGPQLAEILWSHKDLSLPLGVSVADTPGISQALAGSAKGISLTQVLGSTFEVDEVWAHWFHRADVVIWGFCANKMQSAETRAALEGALTLFDKRIVPVATKADLISQDRWPEIRTQFDKIYGPLLSTHKCEPLHLTVCGGQNPQLHGAGLTELRSTLSRLGNEALEIKGQTQERFILDETNSVTGVLKATAQELIANLRAIASLGDTLALEAEKEAQRARDQAASSVDSYLRSLRSGSAISQAAQSVHIATSGGRRGDVEQLAKSALERVVDRTAIQASVDSAFASAARSLEAIAARLAATADIGRLTFRSSGQISRHPVNLHLELRAVKVTGALPFRIRLNYPAGFLANAWDFIKGLFGSDRFSVGDIERALTGALRVDSSDFEEARQQALYKGFAPAIRDAINGSIREHLRDVDAHAINKLKLVDAHLPALCQEREIATTYGAQGEYWATLSPAVETLLNLAREELTRLLPSFRQDLTKPFNYTPPCSFPKASAVWRQRQTSRSSLTFTLPLATVMGQTLYREPYMENGRIHYRVAQFCPYLYSKYHERLQQLDLVRDLDANLARCIVGVKYRSAGERLAELGSVAFKRSVASSRRTWDLQLPVKNFARLSFAPWTGILVILCFVPAVLSIFFFPIIALGLFGSGLVALFIGTLTPYLTFRLRYAREIPKAIENEIAACTENAASQVAPDAVDSVVKNMTAELAPRPLQLLMIKAGLMSSATG